MEANIAAGPLSRDVRMIMPAESEHDLYGQPLMRYFLQNFGRIMVLVFRKQVFPELARDTYCLLAENYGETCSQFSVTNADGSYSLEAFDLEFAYAAKPENVVLPEWANGNSGQ
jgi:hypothetical protein